MHYASNRELAGSASQTWLMTQQRKHHFCGKILPVSTDHLFVEPLDRPESPSLMSCHFLSLYLYLYLL